MSETTSAWLKILKGWGKQKAESKPYRCPYCHRRFRSLAGAQGHWAVIHERFGYEKPEYDKVGIRNLQSVVGKKSKAVQLAEARHKAKDVKHRHHRSIEDCKRTIEEYETALLTMTSSDYKLKTGISKQRINEIRKRLKKLEAQ